MHEKLRRRAEQSWSCSVVARVVAPLCEKKKEQRERKNTPRENKLSRKK
jgi:hypothetical protein